MYTNATYRPNIDGSCGRLPDLFERTESGDAVVRADCGSRSLLLGDRAEKGFAMMSNFGGRRGFSRCDAHVLALVFVMMAIAETRADVRMVRYRRSRPTKFLGPPDDQSQTDFKPTAQYFCQETRTEENRRARRLVSHWKPRTPATLGCSPGKLHRKTSMRTISSGRSASRAKGSGTRSCCLQFTYRYDGGKTFGFTLDNAMATIVEDDKTKR